jgi:hypothetical protein
MKPIWDSSMNAGDVEETVVDRSCRLGASATHLLAPPS